MIYVLRLTIIIIVSPNTIILNDIFSHHKSKRLFFFLAIAQCTWIYFYLLCITFMNTLVYCNVDKMFGVLKLKLMFDII